MKTPTVDQSVIRTLNVHRLSWMGLVVFVVVFGLLLSLVEPARAAVTTPVTMPTASYGCSGVYHTVRPGETISSIAARYGSTPYRIVSCNGLRSYRVLVGQRLLVPLRQGTSGWLESIDFMRDVTLPAQQILAGDTHP